MSSMVRQWLTVLAVLMAIAINGLSNVYPPAGKNTGEVSDTILSGVLITPEGYAFAIWGVIYIGLIAYSVYQFLPVQRENSTLAKVSYALIGACLFQIVWLYAFLTFNFWLSVALMAGILLCLGFAYLQTRSIKPTRKARWLVQAPISVYFGWITVAAVVNVAGALYITNRSPEPAVNVLEVLNSASTNDIVWTVVMMCVSAGIGGLIARQYRDVVYPGVVVWALVAIAIRHIGALPIISILGVGLSVGLVVMMVRILTAKPKQT